MTDASQGSAAHLVYTAPDSASLHKCAPPERDVIAKPPSNNGGQWTKVGTEPSVPVGSVWRCHCGQQWIVRWDSGVRKHGYTPAHPYWDRARWLERRRAKRLAQSDSAPDAVVVSDERDGLAARAAHYADDARTIVARVTLYEDVHPDDAPCLESLLRAVPDIAWRGHDDGTCARLGNEKQKGGPWTGVQGAGPR